MGNCSSSEKFLTMHLLLSFAFGFEILVGSSTKQTFRYWWLRYSWHTGFINSLLISLICLLLHYYIITLLHLKSICFARLLRHYERIQPLTTVHEIYMFYLPNWRSVLGKTWWYMQSRLRVICTFRLCLVKTYLYFPLCLSIFLFLLYVLAFFFGWFYPTSSVL